MENIYYNIVLNKDVVKSIYKTDHIFPKGFLVYKMLTLDRLTSYLLSLNNGEGISIKDHPNIKVEFCLEDLTIELYIGEDENDYPKIKCPLKCPVHHRVYNSYFFDSSIPIIVKLAEKYLTPYDDLFNTLTYSQLKTEFDLLIKEEDTPDSYYTWSPQYKKDLALIEQELNRKLHVR